MLNGRLGLETARIPHVDRYGLVWLGRGNLFVEDGTLKFTAAGSPGLKAGEYALPFQVLSLVLIGPGTTVTHDVFRLLARHGTGLAAVGEDGVRIYTAPPLGGNDAELARKQARLWADEETRLEVARRMYCVRMGEIPPADDLETLRGIEGMRMKQVYVNMARKHGISWRGRNYDRLNPERTDTPNMAINHASTAVEAAATIAVAATGTLPQIGFIHESSANAFCLDIADLYRDEITLSVAFRAVKACLAEPSITLERHVRRLAGKVFREKKLIPNMIFRIRKLLS